MLRTLNISKRCTPGCLLFTFNFCLHIHGLASQLTLHSSAARCFLHLKHSSPPRATLNISKDTHPACFHYLSAHYTKHFQKMHTQLVFIIYLHTTLNIFKRRTHSLFSLFIYLHTHRLSSWCQHYYTRPS